MNLYNWTCRFIQIDKFKYKCQLCDKVITSYSPEPPTMLCNYLLQHNTPSDFGYIYNENIPDLDKSVDQPLASGLPTQKPTLVDKAINFSKAAIQHAMKGSPKCTDEEINTRYNICQSCEYFQNQTCKLCGCNLVRERIYMNKLAWADQSCPIKKWGPISKNPNETGDPQT